MPIKKLALLNVNIGISSKEKEPIYEFFLQASSSTKLVNLIIREVSLNKESILDLIYHAFAFPYTLMLQAFSLMEV